MLVAPFGNPHVVRIPLVSRFGPLLLPGTSWPAAPPGDGELGRGRKGKLPAGFGRRRQDHWWRRRQYGVRGTTGGSVEWG